MRSLLTAAVFTFFTAGVSAQAPDAPNEFQKLPWIAGPGVGQIADEASIKLSDQLMFLGEQGTRRFLELLGNPPRSNHYAIVPNDGSDWFAVFSFSGEGYVKDSEKLDADALLAAIKESDGPGNEERKRLGMSPMYTDGWQVAPHYDATTQRLEWGVRLRDDNGNMTVNYATRLLGRNGVMSAILVTDPASLEKDRVAFNQALAGFQYNAGKTYAEFTEGDKVAAYGLGALVLGGAAAAAAKSGAGKAIFKGLGIAILAGAAGAWALVKKLFGRRRESVTVRSE
jgi:uncharacterized membrane-anchored protein